MVSFKTGKSDHIFYLHYFKETGNGITVFSLSGKYNSACCLLATGFLFQNLNGFSTNVSFLFP